VYELPELEPTERFRPLRPLMEARGVEPGGPLGRVPAGAELAALREAVPSLRAELIESGTPTGVTTCDLITLPYPTEFGLWRAANVRAPYLWITNRMLVVQWDEAGRTRTLLWEPSDHERGEHTPYFARLKRETPLPSSVLTTAHGTVPGHLQALGIAPADVDYLAFDHLHTQDVRRLVGTTRPAPDLGYTDRPVPAWFPNATLLTQAQEWDALRHLHPLQAPWYQPATYLDLPTERLALVHGDVLLGPGVGLVATPGHTAGNMSLVLHTDEGLWVSSENGIAAESWTPQASRIAGVQRFRRDWGQDVVLNANTIEFAAWQYDSMIVESLVADRTADGLFPRCFPSSELTAHRLSPGTRPTHVHGAIEHGRIRSGAVLLSASS
jgi:hypothetical protein